MIETEAESELMAACHTNVLLLQQIFVQAQKWHLDLGKNNIKIIVGLKISWTRKKNTAVWDKIHTLPPFFSFSPFI